MTVKINLIISEMKLARQNVTIHKLRSSTADVAQLVEYWSTLCEAQGLSPSTTKTRGVGKRNKLCHCLSHVCNTRAVLHK